MKKIVIGPLVFCWLLLSGSASAWISSTSTITEIWSYQNNETYIRFASGVLCSIPDSDTVLLSTALSALHTKSAVTYHCYDLNGSDPAPFGLPASRIHRLVVNAL